MHDNSQAARAARAHRAKKNRKPREVYDIKQLRVAGREVRDNDLWASSGRRWRDTHRWIPLSIRTIQACCLVATLAASAALASVILRDPPILLLAYPDGSIRCAPTPVNPHTGQARPRTRGEVALCDKLEKKFGV